MPSQTQVSRLQPPPSYLDPDPALPLSDSNIQVLSPLLSPQVPASYHKKRPNSEHIFGHLAQLAHILAASFWLGYYISWASVLCLFKQGQRTMKTFTDFFLTSCFFFISPMRRMEVIEPPGEYKHWGVYVGLLLSRDMKQTTSIGWFPNRKGVLKV